jgi:hypothetical protein
MISFAFEQKTQGSDRKPPVFRRIAAEKRFSQGMSNLGRPLLI